MRSRRKKEQKRIIVKQYSTNKKAKQKLQFIISKESLMIR